MTTGMAQCFVPAHHLRLIITCISFGSIFLWILSGVYLPSTNDQAQLVTRGWSGRHLLELQDDGGATDNSTCTNVTIVVDGSPVDLDDAHVSF